MANRDAVLSLVGLAVRARKAAGGGYAVSKAVRDGTAVLVLLAGDASENTQKKLRNMCTFYEVDILTYGTKETLGKAVGKDEQACLVILDQGFASSVLERTNRVS